MIAADPLTWPGVLIRQFVPAVHSPSPPLCLVKRSISPKAGSPLHVLEPALTRKNLFQASDSMDKDEHPESH